MNTTNGRTIMGDFNRAIIDEFRANKGELGGDGTAAARHDVAPRPSAWTNESGEQLSDLHFGGSGHDYRVAGSEGAQVVLVLGFDDTEGPRNRVIEPWAEDNPPSPVDIPMSVRGGPAPDRTLRGRPFLRAGRT